MAVYFDTTTPKALLQKFDAAISQSEAKGKITTWEKSDDGIYYTHKAIEWKGKAWFKPSVTSSILVFNIIKPQSSIISTLVYAYYHGHINETFLNHFDSDFSQGRSTAMPAAGDHCGS